MPYSNTETPGPFARIVPKLLRFGLWTTIVVFAFVLQVLPFLLVMTMFNLAIGVTSGVTLVLIPIVAFGMLFFACWIATRQTKDFTGEAQEHAKRQIYIAPYHNRGGHTSVLPLIQRWRSRLY